MNAERIKALLDEHPNWTHKGTTWTCRCGARLGPFNDPDTSKGIEPWPLYRAHVAEVIAREEDSLLTQVSETNRDMRAVIMDLRAKVREAGEREARLRALADEWEEICLGTICNSCGADNFSGASKFADSLRALLDQHEGGEGRG